MERSGNCAFVPQNKCPAASLRVVRVLWQVYTSTLLLAGARLQMLAASI